MSSGVRRVLDAAIDRAAMKPAYGVGFYVGSVVSSALLFVLGRRLNRD